MKQTLSFSRLTKSDLPKIADLQPEFWGNIIPTIEWYLTLNFCHPVKVTLGQQVVGCGAVLLHENSAWLANIIVHKEYRNQGIGLAITRYIMEMALKHTNQVLLIATQLGLPVYTKLGFKADEEYLFFNPGRVRPPLSGNIQPYLPRFKETILEMDKVCSGEIRTKLLLPRLQGAFVYLKDGNVEGFCIPTLGEGLSFAYTKEAGLALMSVGLQEEKRACLPKSNGTGIDFLLQQGFTLNENLYGVKMFLHNKPDWKPQFQYGRVGGNMG